MSKSKTNPEEKDAVLETDEIKETLIDDEEKDVDPELVVGDLDDDIDDEMSDSLDEDEVDPFKDKWEE